jgi:diguanylate cyclase (GGDEF)-like protein
VKTGDEKFKILVVEDSTYNLYVIEKMLEDQYVVGKAATAQEGLLAAQIFSPHLILLDIILPDANGFDLLVRLKEMDSTKNIPVILITGLDSEAAEEWGFRLGAVDYIKKPFRETIVKARVNTQIRAIKQLQVLEEMSLLDALTGISNRRAFDQQIQFEWNHALRNRCEVSLLMLDVDQFKEYNDTYGHPQGDVMLQRIAQVMRGELKRSLDISCRYGGEEFAVLLPGTGLEGARAVAERIREAVAETQVYDPDTKRATRPTVSIGVATAFPAGGDRLSELIERADRLLYQAKSKGRNRVESGESGAD